MGNRNIQIEIGKESEDCVELLVAVNDTIAKTIYENTKCPKEKLNEYISDNIFPYMISNLGEIENKKIIETAENIANNMSTEEFINTILTDEGKDMMPAKMHEIMQNKYCLKGDVEWFLVLMFINLGGLITQPEFCYRSIEEDMEADDCIVVEITY